MKILSLGYTRFLWDGASHPETQRLLDYSRHTTRYTLITVSRAHHRIGPLTLNSSLSAIPTSGWSPIDNVIRMLVRSWQVLRLERYDIIQAQDPYYTGLAGLLLSLLTRIPLNVCVYGANPFDRFFLKSSMILRLLRPIAIQVLRRAASIQVDSDESASLLTARGIDAAKIRRSFLLPADIGDFMKVPDEDGSPEIRLLAIGRLAPQKAFHRLVELAAILNTRSEIPFQLTIVGDGPLLKDLKTLVSDRGLDSVVSLPGAYNREELMRELSSSHIVLLSSLYEGFPRVLLEAALASRPAVSTEVCGARELVQDGVTGFVIPQDDQTSFVEKVLSLMASASLRQSLGRAARSHGRAIFEKSRGFPSQVRIWKDIVATTPSRDFG